MLYGDIGHATIPPREGLNFPPRPRGGIMKSDM